MEHDNKYICYTMDFINIKPYVCLYYLVVDLVSPLGEGDCHQYPLMKRWRLSAM